MLYWEVKTNLVAFFLIFCIAEKRLVRYSTIKSYVLRNKVLG